MYRVEFQRLSFLVIDDSRHMRRVMRTMLHGFGSRDVHEAEDGIAGLEMLAAVRPDIVLLDWEMPILTGLEVARLIRGGDGKVDALVPIVLVTAHTERQKVLEARDAGVNEFLAKPVSPQSLHDRLLSVVAHPRPFIKTGTYFGPDRRPAVPGSYAGPERRHAAQGEEARPPDPKSRR
jgi:two-component system chemotaxis response regulator CheY